MLASPLNGMERNSFFLFPPSTFLSPYYCLGQLEYFSSPGEAAAAAVDSARNLFVLLFVLVGQLRGHCNGCWL